MGAGSGRRSGASRHLRLIAGGTSFPRKLIAALLISASDQPPNRSRAQHRRA